MKEGRKEGRKDGSKEGRKEGRKEATPPTTLLICRMFTEINAPLLNHHFFDHHQPLLKHHFFEHHGGGPPPNPLHFFDHHGGGGAAPLPPPLIFGMFTQINAPCAESSLLRTSCGGGAAPPQTPLLVCRMFAEINALFAEASLLRSSSAFVESSLLQTSWGAVCTAPCESPAPAMKSVPALRKHCACHEICT